MTSILRLIFIDRHGDIRLGWKIAGFMCLVLFSVSVLILPLRLAGVESPVTEKMMLLAAAFAATLVFTRYVNRKPVRAVGLWIHPHALRELGIGSLLGFLMMAGIVAVEYALGYVSLSQTGAGTADLLGTAAVSLLWFGGGAMAEELLFRGYAFQTLIQAVTFIPATLLMAVVFALAHLQNPHVTPFSLTNIVLSGVLFSFAYMKTRSLWLPFGIHFAWNFSQTTIFGLPTSGLADGAHELVRAAQSGPAWVGGGDFGPEGGVLATIALMTSLWYVLKAPYLKAPEGIVTLDSIEDLVPAGGGADGRP
jgi:uncharacterized protein